MVLKSSGVFGNFEKFSENFGNGLKCFSDVLKFSENLQKSSEVFGNHWNFLENFRNGSKVFFRSIF